MPQNNANNKRVIYTYSWCLEGFDKNDRNHHEGKISLTCQNTLGTSKELFEFTIRIFVYKIVQTAPALC